MPNGGHWHTKNPTSGKRARRRTMKSAAFARRIERGAAKLARKRERLAKRIARLGMIGEES